jgi:hypothetical protein
MIGRAIYVGQPADNFLFTVVNKRTGQDLVRSDDSIIGVLP